MTTPQNESGIGNPMHELDIDKVVVHMGVGESGEKLSKAIDIMKAITGNTPVRSIAKKTQPAFGIRKGAPIGCRVTLRGKKAKTFLETSLNIIDVNVVLARKGLRISRRHREQKKLPEKQHVNVTDSIAFLKNRYKVEV